MNEIKVDLRTSALQPIPEDHKNLVESITIDAVLVLAERIRSFEILCFVLFPSQEFLKVSQTLFDWRVYWNDHIEIQGIFRNCVALSQINSFEESFVIRPPLIKLRREDLLLRSPLAIISATLLQVVLQFGNLVGELKKLIPDPDELSVRFDCRL